MPHSYYTQPDEQSCAVCLKAQPIGKFDRYRVRAAERATARYRYANVCNPCRERWRRDRLSEQEVRRYVEVSSRNLQRAQRHKSKRKLTGKDRRLPQGAAPFEVAVAELEAEWGIPSKEWTLAQDLLCTRRMYELLGWPVKSLARDSEQARAVKHYKIRNTPVRGAAAREGADDHHGDEEDDGT